MATSENLRTQLFLGSVRLTRGLKRELTEKIASEEGLVITDGYSPIKKGEILGKVTEIRFAKTHSSNTALIDWYGKRGRAGDFTLARNLISNELYVAYYFAPGRR